MLCRSTWLLWLFLTTVAIPAAAHPGHGTPGSEASPAHYATEPFHALPLVAGVVVAAALLWRVLHNPKRERGI